MAKRARVIAEVGPLKLHDPGTGASDWAMKGDLIVCARWVSEHFNVPDAAKRIHLIAYDRPVNHTIRVQLASYAACFALVGPGKVAHFVFDGASHKIVDRIGERAFWLGVEYEL